MLNSMSPVASRHRAHLRQATFGPAKSTRAGIAEKLLRTGKVRADTERVRQHCAQCLTEVFTDGRQAPTGETLCPACYSALWGARKNGDRLASNGNGRNGNARRRLSQRSGGQKQGQGRAVWLVGPTR